MRRHLIIAALGSLLCMPAAAQRPTVEEQRRTLDSARDIAIHYTSKLPDFICTEQVERTDRTSPTIMKADRLTIQLSYFGQKEKQKLVAMNGNRTEQPLESLDGLITGGELAACYWVFSICPRPPISSGRHCPTLASVLRPSIRTASRAPSRITCWATAWRPETWWRRRPATAAK